MFGDDVKYEPAGNVAINLLYLAYLQVLYKDKTGDRITLGWNYLKKLGSRNDYFCPKENQYVS